MTVNTSTKQTTLQQAEAAAAEAETKLQAARDEARELQAKADAEAKQAERDEQTARIRFEQQRAKDYAANHVKPLRELRAEFEDAVINGGNAPGAWINYMAAVRAAAGEQRHLPRLQREQATARHEAVSKQIEEWQNELQARANRVTGDRPAYEADREPSGWWTDTIRDLIGDDTPGNSETRVRQINRRLNSLAEALHKNTRRELDSTDWIHTLYYTERPGHLRDGDGPAERRTYAQALQQAIDKGIEQAAAELARQRAEAYAEFSNQK